jgi:hypothetical protein
VHEIEHPPVRQRLGQYAYLTGIAVVALAIGTALTAVSRMDFAERGMNGTLAWMQTTGMPMRPAMSVMMTAEIDPAPADDAGLDVKLDVPDSTRPGVPIRVTATVADAETGEPVEDLTRSHEAWMHLIATRDDLGTFAHVHPEPTGAPGELAVDLTFPTAGRYVVNTEFRQQGQMSDVHQRQVVTVEGDAPAPVVLTAGPREVVVDGVRVELGGDAVVGELSDLHFAFTDARTGEPVDDLQPYLAAAGHVVVMRADATTFAHEHAEVQDSRGRPVMAMPAPPSVLSSTCTRSSTTPAPTSCGASSAPQTATCSPSRSPSTPAEPPASTPGGRPEPSTGRPPGHHPPSRHSEDQHAGSRRHRHRCRPAGLAAAHALGPTDLHSTVLEAGQQPGGSWPHFYDSLTPVLPGEVLRAAGPAVRRRQRRYPHRDEAAAYLRQYAEHFQLPIRTDSRVRRCRSPPDGFTVELARRRR